MLIFSRYFGQLSRIIEPVLEHELHTREFKTIIQRIALQLKVPNIIHGIAAPHIDIPKKIPMVAAQHNMESRL